MMNLESLLQNNRNIKNHWVAGDFNINLFGYDKLSLHFLNNFLEKEMTGGQGTCIDVFFIKIAQ